MSACVRACVCLCVCVCVCACACACGCVTDLHRCYTVGVRRAHVHGSSVVPWLKVAAGRTATFVAASAKTALPRSPRDEAVARAHEREQISLAPAFFAEAVAKQCSVLLLSRWSLPMHFFMWRA